MQRAGFTTYLTLFALSVLSAGAWGSDWPQYRCDAERTAASEQSLPAVMHLLWERELATPRPAFPGELRLRYDASYEPVVMGKRMFVPSMVTDSVTALDTETGRETWRFFAEGPVRLAPVAWRDKVYFVSDDGHLYCVDAADGKLIWKFRGLPAGREDRKIMGDGRLISVFPARGGPVLADGIIYFAAGIWADEGVFVHALNAETGRVIWSNTNSDRIDMANADHGVAAPAGISPQGHLAIVNDTLVVPCGFHLPALLDLKTGDLHTYTIGWGGKYRMPKGSAFVSGIGSYLIHTGDLYDMKPFGKGPSLNRLTAEHNRPEKTTEEGLRQWEAWLNQTGGAFDRQRMIHVAALPRLQVERNNEKELGDFREPVLTPEAMYYQQDGIAAYDLTKPELRTKGVAKVSESPGEETDNEKERKERYPDPASLVFPELWRLPGESKVHIKAGGRLYCGRPGAVEAVDIPDPGGMPKTSWRAEVQGTPHRMLAADGKLFVVTLEGRIYAFGGNKPTQPVEYRLPNPRTPSPDKWTEKAAKILGDAEIIDGYILIFDLADPGLAEELVRQSKCDVIAIEADAARAEEFRKRFQRMGLYGSRISILFGDPATYRLPPYLAGLIVLDSPDLNARAQETAFVKALFRCLRPYGGTVRLEIPATVLKSLAKSVSAGEFQGGVLREKGKHVLLIREGSLAGAADWSHAGANAANTGASRDHLVKPPLKRLWFDGAMRWGKKPGMTEVRIAGGRVLVRSDKLYALDAYTGRHLWQAASKSARGKLVALEDAIYMVDGKSCVVLDPARGGKSFEMKFPGDSKGYWSSIRVSGEILVAASGKCLAAVDRNTARVLWDHTCENKIESIALGGGKVFVSDQVNRRRVAVEPNDPGGTTMAFDARKGERLWKIDATGEILYSESHDVVVIGADVYRDSDGQPPVNSGYPLKKMTAYRGADGKPLWSDLWGTHAFIVGDKLISYRTWKTPKHAAVSVCNLLTGEKTGNEIEWWQRGCTVLRAGSNLLTTRYLGHAAYYDLARGQMTSISNVRAACGNNLFPADGLLNAPDLTGGCNCNYLPISQGFAPSSAFE